ncbi:MAG: GyrI-like domain-containing protein [Anaerolineaceae bacterium]
MTVQCVLESMEMQPIVSIRVRTPVAGLQQVLGSGYGAIMQQLSAQGIFPSGAPFVVYYNMDMEDLDIELGFPVGGASATVQAPVQVSSLPASHVAACVYKGPYTEMGSAYETLNAFIREHGLEPQGVVYEFYLNDPVTTPPDQLETRIVFPLK